MIVPTSLPAALSSIEKTQDWEEVAQGLQAWHLLSLPELCADYFLAPGLVLVHQSAESWAGAEVFEQKESRGEVTHPQVLRSSQVDLNSA